MISRLGVGVKGFREAGWSTIGAGVDRGWEKPIDKFWGQKNKSPGQRGKGVILRRVSGQM